MKISSELIQGANQYINPMKDRALDLKGKYHLRTKVIIFKGYKIGLIENMGATLVTLIPFEDHC